MGEQSIENSIEHLVNYMVTGFDGDAAAVEDSMEEYGRTKDPSRVEIAEEALERIKDYHKVPYDILATDPKYNALRVIKSWLGPMESKIGLLNDGKDEATGEIKNLATFIRTLGRLYKEQLQQQPHPEQYHPYETVH